MRINRRQTTRTAILGLAVIAAIPGPAFAAPPASVTDTATRDARTLAELVAPRETMIALNMEWAHRGIQQLAEFDPDSKAFETDYPGIHAAMWAAVENELRNQLESEIPQLWERLGALYLEELNPQEIRAVLDFYRTPTGQRLVRSLYANADAQPMIDSMITSDDGSISAESMVESHESTKREAIAEADIQADDVLALIRLVELDRVRVVGAKVQEITAAWVNEEDPEKQAIIDRLMMDAADSFIAAHDAES